jgi:PAS domain S-box-containing protein
VLQTIVELTRFLARSQDIRDALHAVVSCVTECFGAADCNVILAHPGEAAAHLGATSRVASRDGPSLNLSIDLHAHPDVRTVLGAGHTLVVENVDAPSMAKAQLLGLRSPTPPGPHTLVIVPLSHDGGPQGVLYTHFAGGHAPDAAARELLELVANATAMALRNAQMNESLLYEKKQITEQRARVEHRMRFFQRYADFFESAADGMIVVDHAGRILFSNPRASEITGYSRSELTNASVLSFLSRREIRRTANLVRGFRQGIYPRGVDVSFTPKSALAARKGRKGGVSKDLTLNVTFSPVLRAERAVLFTFRDVTLERATEVELRRTTEFLERVIDSSVDAIVSSDMTGRVLLFNRAAARIFGYEPADVIGKLNVERLYPAGVAREVMRKIRSPDHGGPRRLEDYRVDMMGSRGETIPVNISAALIMDNDRPIGSVGVFTDVRDKIRMESRLQLAQEELREREKSLALAELAGTTAHELNQPLTGVIGYAEILMRQIKPDSPFAPALEVILSESQRMASIVKKIGKITRYETRNYLGDTNILDLDKAAPESKEERGSAG